jgi:hypothetical protein
LTAFIVFLKTIKAVPSFLFPKRESNVCNHDRR